MAQVLTHQGLRCQEHPHRTTEQRCDRCRQPFCEECLFPGRRRPDGTRGWYCAGCLAKVTAEEEAAAYQRTLAARVEQTKQRARLAFVGAGVVGVLLIAGIVLVRLLASSAPTGERTLAGAPEAKCGELSRIRSIGSIGTQGAEDAVNLLTYPQRAAVSLTSTSDAGAPAGGAAGGTSSGAIGDPNTIVDECDSGWRATERVTLPVTLTLDTKRTGSFVQRIALWQDKTAPKSTWILDFELLASTSESGDDFVPLKFDRPTQLRESTEAQWFEIMRSGPGAGAQTFPDVVPIRRLQIRILSTHGSPRLRSEAEGVSLGEVAAYGPDLELQIGNVEDTPNFAFKPYELRALAGQPKFVLIMNQSTQTHIIATAGQTRNMEVKVEPGQAISGQFVAAPRAGRYEFFCKVPGHDRLGLAGSIIVR